MATEEKTCDVLVLAAHALELRGFLPRLGADLRGVVCGQRMVCSAVGVGLAAAAIGATQALAVHRPRVVVLVGSYGLFPDRDGALLELAVVEHVRLIDSQVLAQRAAFPEPMPTQHALDASLTRGIKASNPNSHSVNMATTLAITTDDDLAMELARGCECRGENLETFSIVHACREAEVQVAALLGATNWVGSHGRAQWRQHHAAMADATAAAVLHWLDSGAEGLQR